jgi:hypothetical protein
MWCSRCGIRRADRLAGLSHRPERGRLKEIRAAQAAVAPTPTQQLYVTVLRAERTLGRDCSRRRDHVVEGLRALERDPIENA